MTASSVLGKSNFFRVPSSAFVKNLRKYFQMLVLNCFTSEIALLSAPVQKSDDLGSMISPFIFLGLLAVTEKSSRHLLVVPNILTDTLDGSIDTLRILVATTSLDHRMTDYDDPIPDVIVHVNTIVTNTCNLSSSNGR
jgi:hypothetical protein